MTLEEKRQADKELLTEFMKAIDIPQIDLEKMQTKYGILVFSMFANSIDKAVDKLKSHIEKMS